ncbi:MAG: sulfur-oxidizing protein SoxX [Pseudohongiellaceae bacterium]|jgi:sulfur-oxidizing protein SoxX
MHKLLIKIRPTIKLLALSVTVAIFMLVSMISMASTADDIAEGKQLAFDRKKGNCLACHAMEGGDLAGNTGPPMIVMQARYPDRSKLSQQIADPTIKNPNTLMPPFGRHGILTDTEIEKITTYLLTL